MKKQYLILLCGMLCLLVNVQAQRDTVWLTNAWSFQPDTGAVGQQQQWFTKILPAAETVSLPHTWNVDEQWQHHYGWAWYQHNLMVPAAWKSKQLTLQFGAVNHTAIVYVNGQEVARHSGDGFNKFFVPISKYVQAGKENRITVACNNAYSANKVPFSNSFDWPNDGGLIRPVALLINETPVLTTLKATPVLDEADSAGTLRLQVAQPGAIKKPYQLAIRLSEVNGSGTVLYEQTQIPVWQQGTTDITVNLPKVKPWHFDFPNLYRLEVTVLDGKKAVDKQHADIGFRNFRLKDGKIWLNGEAVKLMGVEWTAGSNPQYGFAEPAAEIIRHAQLMKDVNAIFTRVHFQQDDVFYDFCNRNGILVQEEVPLWGGETPANDTIRHIATAQVQTMIQQHYNHPSIVSWGMGNELQGRLPAMQQMIAGLVATARSLDSTRMINYVSNTVAHSFYNHPAFVPDAAALGDAILMNEYGGSWWSIPTGSLGSYLDSVHATYPDKVMMISEFGLCEPNFKGGDPRRITDLIYHMAVYESKPYIEAAIYFDLTDYRTHYPGTTDEPKYRRRIHGVYDMYGQPKPSMKVLRELSSPLEVQQVHRWKKGMLTVQLFGSMGLPQHRCTGYTVQVGGTLAEAMNAVPVTIPTTMPGKQVFVEVKDHGQPQSVVIVRRPSGQLVSVWPGE